MASFTDNPQRLTQFNPYIQQMPVEAMTQVGTAKQGMYDQGIQRIQSQIDNIAGMDIVRDVDKQYLQSKLHQLTSDLKLVAAADFSNYQLTNAVGGMVNNIGKDENVINAVTSTSRYRKELQRGEEFKKNGKWSVNREYDFNRGVEDWMNNGEVGAQFNGRYVEHTDVNKKVVEAILKLNPNVSASDMPYTQNPDGTINWGVIAGAMKRAGVKEVDEGKIKTAVNAILDSNDFDELASQGRYHFRNSTPEDIQAITLESYKGARASYQDRLKKINERLLTTPDIAGQNQLNEAAKYYKDQLGTDNNPGQLELHYKNILESIGTNIDGVKADIYTRNWLDQMANGFAYRDVSEQIIDNPYRKDFWEDQKFKLDERKQAWTEKYQQRQLEIDAEKVRKMKDESGTGKDAYYENTGNETDNKLKSRENFNNYNLELSSQNESIVKDLANKASSIDNTVSPATILENIKLSDEGKYTPKTKYERDQFKIYKRNRSILKSQELLLEKVQQQAVTQIQDEKKREFEGEIAAIPDVQVNYTNGSSDKYTPSELLEVMLKGDYDNSGVRLPDDSKLNDRERKIKQYFQDRLNRFGAGDVKDIYDEVDHIARKIMKETIDESSGKQWAQKAIKGLFTKDNSEKVEDRVTDILGDYTGEFMTQSSSVRFEKASPDKDNFISELNRKLEADLSSGGGGKDYKPGKIKEVLKRSDEISFSVKNNGNNYSITVIDNANDEKGYDIPVTEEFIRNNPYLGEGYVAKNVDIAKVILTNNGTTNAHKNYADAYYSPEYFGHIVPGKGWSVTLPVVADLEEKGGELYPVFRMVTKNGIITLNYWNSTDRELFENQYLPSLTDEDIIKLFETEYTDIKSLINK